MTALANFMLTDAEFNLVREVVYQHCGISLNDEKIALVRARLAKQMRKGGFTSVRSYLDYVLRDRNDPAFSGFIDAISTNLTSFFRENQHFDFLSQTFLPDLIAKKREAGDNKLIAWSAACSSGEEPYTIAMTLLEATGQTTGTPMRWDMRLLATDISTAMVATAREGIYSEAKLLSVPPSYRTRYFRTHPLKQGTFEVSPELRQIAQFKHLNLMNSWPFKGPFDFIFCRNVMIYFDRPTQQKLVDRFWDCLRPGGLLFTGHSESLTSIPHRFTHRFPSIYQKCDS